MLNWSERNGVWVSTGAGVGIRIREHVAVTPDGSRRIVPAAHASAPGEILTREWWVHLVNADGTTLAQIPERSAGKIEQAVYAQIPESRRPGEDVAQRLGYWLEAA